MPKSTTALTERRYCQRKGCRRWWVFDPIRKRPGVPRRYCDKCRDSSKRRREAASPGVRQRELARSREKTADYTDDRVGLRVDRPYGPCERCLDHPARKGFSFCMKCSVCAACGKNKPEIGRFRCRVCRLSRNESERANNRLPAVKSRRAAYLKRPEVKASIDESRRRREADPQFKEKRRARWRVAYHSPERVAAMARRVCALRGCTKLLAGRNANAIYCSEPCNQRAYKERHFPGQVEALDRRVCALPGCEKRLVGKRADAIYCSAACRSTCTSRRSRQRA